MLAARCGVAALQRVPASALPRACAARLSTQAATHDGEFKGRVAVVTGGAVGIGRGICEAWARAGGIVVCGDIDTQAAKELKEASADYPGEVHVREFDASVEDQCLELVDGAAAEFGRLDALVNNVGVQADDGTGVHCLDTATWHKVLAVNLTSYFLCSRAALGHFLPAKSGAIVNMASVQGLQSQSGIPAYAASKGAVLSLTRQMAVQYGADGVRVNAICPGTIDTPLVRNVLQQRGWEVEAAGAPYPMARIGTTEEVAEACLFLLSTRRASFITGEALCVDGGIMAVGSWAANA